MSKPIPGDTVLTLDPRDPSFGVRPAIVLDVGVGTIDATVWILLPNNDPPDATHRYVRDLTEVPDVASLTAGTWCRREVCG